MGSFGPTHQGLQFKAYILRVTCVRVDCSNLNDKKSYSPKTLDKSPLHCRQVIVFVNLLHDINTFKHPYKYPGRACHSIKWDGENCKVNSRLCLTEPEHHTKTHCGNKFVQAPTPCNFVICSKIMFHWKQKIVV